MGSPLTFGIELECICVHERNAFNNTQYPDLVPDVEYSEQYDVGAIHAVQYFLHKHGVVEDSSKGPYSTWTVEQDDGDLPKASSSLKPDNYIAQSIELASPIFRFDDSESFAKIERVLEVLKWMEEHFDCHFIINETCGLHVHFACGKEKIPFEIAKRIYQIFLAHEQSIDSIHAASRILAPNWTRHGYIPGHPLYAPLSAFQGNAHLLNMWSDAEDWNLLAWLRKVEDCNDYGYLCGTFELILPSGGLQGHEAAVNFDNAHDHTDRHDAVARGRKTTKTTIEFRQHLGTLDANEIYRYVVLLGCIITACAKASEEAFIEALLSATLPTYTFEQFCSTIGIPTDVLALLRQQQPPAPANAPTMAEHPCTIKAFLAMNDYENAVNRDPAKVAAKIDEKFRTTYYGIKPTAQPLAFDAPHIRDLLVWARAAKKPRSRWDDEITESMVRSEFFTTLAEVYATTDSSLGAEEQVRSIEQLFMDCKIAFLIKIIEKWQVYRAR